MPRSMTITPAQKILELRSMSATLAASPMKFRETPSISSQELVLQIQRSSSGLLERLVTVRMNVSKFREMEGATTSAGT